MVAVRDLGSYNNEISSRCQYGSASVGFDLSITLASRRSSDVSVGSSPRFWSTVDYILVGCIVSETLATESYRVSGIYVPVDYTSESDLDVCSRNI